MASVFWTLEDGRTFTRRWSWMAYMLKLITNELSIMPEAKEFYEYLEKFVYRKDRGDSHNGYGGFIRENKNIMFNFDLRTFAPKNRVFFWQATQKSLSKLIVQKKEKDEGVIYLLTMLLDMHKRINKGEDPMYLNHFNIIEPNPNEKLGPGW